LGCLFFFVEKLKWVRTELTSDNYSQQYFSQENYLPIASLIENNRLF
jgi:hypothetical protein